MSKLLLLLISAILSAALMWAHEEAKLTPGQREVVNVHNTMREAARSRDFGAWSAYVADDCIFTTDDGEITTKAKIIQHMRSMPQADDHSEDLRDFVVHVYGDTAVLNVRFTAHEQFNLSDIVTEMREMETFIRRAGSWLLVARQWEPLPINFRRPAVANPSSTRTTPGATSGDRADLWIQSR